VPAYDRLGLARGLPGVPRVRVLRRAAAAELADRARHTADDRCGPSRAHATAAIHHPHQEQWDEERQEDLWFSGDNVIGSGAGAAAAGWSEAPPNHPRRISDVETSLWDNAERVKVMDKYGIYTQVMFPNLLTFSVHAFMSMKDPELMTDCVKAYNDHQVDFASEAPDRFVKLTAIPWWDIDAAAKEIVRSYENGHRGILLMSKPNKLDLPPLVDPYWDPVFNTVAELGVSVNFHVGYQEFTEDDLRNVIGRSTSRADYAKESSMALIGLAEGLAGVITSGLCHKYPTVPFVLVESGFGWVPFMAETLDWQWLNSGAHESFPERLMPSEYIRRQVYGSFWCESGTIRSMGEDWCDNLMFETDYPHATSLSPGPVSAAREPWKRKIDN